MKESLKKLGRIAALLSLVAGNLLVGSAVVRNIGAQEPNEELFACPMGHTCHCFSTSYCTDWPTGASCTSTNDCNKP